jgi:hypothetical protein
MMATGYCLSPGEWTQTGDQRQGKEQAPAATTKSAGAKRRALQCLSFIAGTVKAARPERSQQALPLTSSDIRH